MDIVLKNAEIAQAVVKGLIVDGVLANRSFVYDAQLRARPGDDGQMDIEVRIVVPGTQPEEPGR